MTIATTAFSLAPGHMMYGSDGAGWSHMMYGQSGIWMHPFGGILLLLLFMAVVVFLARVLGGQSGRTGGWSAKDILRSRLASGEITSEEYRQALETLR